jgi:NADPH:quinone reductase-like Zn-dependent oxidoreductase
MSDNHTMHAVRLHAPGEPVIIEEVPVPEPGPGEVLVRVHAAAITRDELDWPTDRLPAIPSYELSGTVADDEVWALLPFDRDGAAAEYVAVPAGLLAPKPRTLGHVESAAIPLPALSAWQGLFDHGRLSGGERVLITGAAGGVGQFATQLARWRGAYVIGTTSGDKDAVLALGADEAVGRDAAGAEPVDLVFDTVGGDALARSGDLIRDGGRVVSVAEEPSAALSERTEANYFIVEPNRDQLTQLARLVDEGAVKPLIDSVFPLADARSAFERLMEPDKRGKVVLRVGDE